MKQTEFISHTSVRMVLTEKAPFLITISKSGHTLYDVYLVRQCANMGEMQKALLNTGINPFARNLSKSLLDPKCHYIIVDGPAKGIPIHKEKCIRLVRGEYYERILNQTTL